MDLRRAPHTKSIRDGLVVLTPEHEINHVLMIRVDVIDTGWDEVRRKVTKSDPESREN